MKFLLKISFIAMAFAVLLLAGCGKKAADTADSNIEKSAEATGTDAQELNDEIQDIENINTELANDSLGLDLDDFENW